MNPNKNAFSESEALVKAILNKMFGISKPCQKFMVHIFILFMSLRCRYTFSNMGRFGQYNEQSYRQHFAKDFDFLRFNTELAKGCGVKNCVIAFDPSYLPKSGKHTSHVDRYYSGTAGRHLWGLEVGMLAVIDLDTKTAMPLETVQTPDMKKLKKAGKTLVDHYAEVILSRKEELTSFSGYLVVDGYFPKQKFVWPILEQTQLHIVTMLRKDSDLRYLYQGPHPHKKGRRKEYDGKVNLKELDPNKVQLVEQTPEKRIYTFAANVKHLKINVRVSIVQRLDKDGKVKDFSVHCSTDLDLPPMTILEYYASRFQVELLIRDAKSHAGLTHCQARDEKKLNFHFNTACSTVGIAKALKYPKDDKERFSMANYKTLFHNQFMINLFFANFHIDLSLKKNQRNYQKFLHYGRIAA